MPKEPSVEKSVKRFMASHMRMPVGDIKPDTRVQDVLALNQAQPFMQEFGEKFDVDMTAFRIERHYGPVGQVSILSRLLFLLLFRKSYGFAPLTTEHLVAAAKSKKWLAP